MKKVILGVSSSIAAYKACELARLLVKAGHSVFPVLTRNATRLISPLTLETLCGNPAYTDVFARDRNLMGHIELKENASLLLVAPATANVIGKFAGGIADDLLTTTFLSVACPVIIAPAMNPGMWAHPAVRANIERLKSWKVRFVEPAEGPAVCGDEGYGRLAEVETIFRAAMDVLGR